MSNFWDLINIDEYWDKRENFNMDRWEISFYCKDCKKLVDVKKEDKEKYIYSCNKCYEFNIVIWTREGLISNYRIK